MHHSFSPEAATATSAAPAAISEPSLSRCENCHLRPRARVCARCAMAHGCAARRTRGVAGQWRQSRPAGPRASRAALLSSAAGRAEAVTVHPRPPVVRHGVSRRLSRWLSRCIPSPRVGGSGPRGAIRLGSRASERERERGRVPVEPEPTPIKRPA
jgi:hypothetical protein